ncbi:hypothetical protein D3C81_1302010 [compost metagenome]
MALQSPPGLRFTPTSEPSWLPLRPMRVPGMEPEPPGTSLPSTVSSGTREKSRAPCSTGSRSVRLNETTALPRSSAKLPPRVMSYLSKAPSFSDVCPCVYAASMPLKFLRMMKLTAPAMASEPYTADAPPVTISTFSMSASGMVARSTTPSELAGMKRRPLTRVSVRLAPRPRRLAVSTPEPPPLLTLDVLPAASCGNSLRTVSMVALPEAWMSSRVTMVVGLGASRSVRIRREPVTITASRLTASLESASCAKAGATSSGLPHSANARPMASLPACGSGRCSTEVCFPRRRAEVDTTVMVSLP